MRTTMSSVQRSVFILRLYHLQSQLGITNCYIISFFVSILVAYKEIDISTDPDYKEALQSTF